jgi:hypothetical protein
MKYSHIAFALLLGGAFATPIAEPQQPSDIDDILDAYDAIPDVADAAAPFGDPSTSSVTYNPTVVASAISSMVATATGAVITSYPTDISARDISLVKRGSCQPEPPGNYPNVPAPDTASNFLDFSPILALAENATTPADYALAPGFINLEAAAQSPTYMTYISSDLTSYDPAVCAAACDSILGCISFNICKCPITAFPNSI